MDAERISYLRAHAAGLGVMDELLNEVERLREVCDRLELSNTLLIGRLQGTDRARQWNERHPIGTPVRFWPGVREGEGKEGVTLFEAWALPGGDAVVMIKGAAGGVALSHVEARHGR